MTKLEKLRIAKALGVTIFVTLTNVATVAEAMPPTTDMPLYDAYQYFCVKTQIRLDEIAKAVQSPTVVVTNFHKFPNLNDTQWEIKFEGRDMVINMHSGQSPNYRRPNQICEITSAHNEDASLAEIRKWLGAPPSAVRGMEQYDFEWNGDKRVLISVEAAKNLDGGGKLTWHIDATTIGIRSGQQAMIRLSRPANPGPFRYH
jgi:hypothetical protein